MVRLENRNSIRRDFEPHDVFLQAEAPTLVVCSHRLLLGERGTLEVMRVELPCRIALLNEPGLGQLAAGLFFRPAHGRAPTLIQQTVCFL